MGSRPRRVARLTCLVGLAIGALGAIVPAGPVPFAELGYEDTSGEGLIDATELRDQEADIAPTIVDTVRGHVGVIIDGEDSIIIGAGVPSIGETVTDIDGTEASVFVLVSLPSPSAAS